jgi:transposase
LKLFGLRLGAVTTPGIRMKRLTVLFDQEPSLRSILSPLHSALCAVEAELAGLDKELKKKTAADPVCRRLMSAPGVGPVTALTFKASIEDPARFVKSQDVGAYAGLTPRRFQSGDMDVSGSISRRGDRLLRRALYEAANALLGRVKRPCALKTWGLQLAEHKGAKRARVAVARKLAILLHRMWVTQQDFDWQRV